MYVTKKAVRPPAQQAEGGRTVLFIPVDSEPRIQAGVNRKAQGSQKGKDDMVHDQDTFEIGCITYR